MPKVSQQYRDARRAQILDAARRCFLREGFHETSMQDLFAESGLSSGAVYRYFAGKDDVILAIAEENMRDVVAEIHAFAVGDVEDGVGEALARVLESVRAKHTENDIGQLALHVWSESARNPELAARFQESLARMRIDLVDVVRGHQQRGTLPGVVSADAIVGLLMAIIPGFILQLTLFGPGAVDGLPAAARALWPGR